MPYQKLMKFMKNRKEWRKRYLTVLYTRSTRQLRKDGYQADDTEDGSRAAANAWWLAKKAEIDTGNIIFAMDTGERLQPFTFPKLNLAGIQEGSKMLAQVSPLPLNISFDSIPKEFHQDNQGRIYGDRQLYYATERERGYWEAKEESRPAVKTEETLGFLIDEYMSNFEAKAAKGIRSPRTVLTLRSNFRTIGNYFGRNNSIKSIVSDKCEAFYYHLVSLDTMQPESKETMYSRFKTFMKVMYTKEKIDILPRFLNTKLEFNDGSEHEREKVVYPIELIRQLLAAGDPNEKLYLLLALNCGFTVSPIAEFDKTKIKNGRYELRRGKTYRYRDVPLVKYVLWPETQELLEEVRIPKDEKRISKDFAALRKRLGLDHEEPAVEHCHLRNTGASFLHNGPHAIYADHWLGHSVKTIADKHYKKVFEQNFDVAVMWLRNEILGGAI